MPEDANQKSSKRLEWEAVSVRSDGGFGEGESLPDFDQTPEPEETLSPSARQTPRFKFDSTTGWSSSEPSLGYYHLTCQACRPKHMCPAHCNDCRDCRKKRKTRPGSSTLDTPPLSSSRLLLSWKLSDLCRSHREEWIRHSGQPYPDLTFQGPTNSFLADYASESQWRPEGYAMKSSLNTPHGLTPQDQQKGFGFKPQHPMPPPSMMMHFKKIHEEDSKKKLEEHNQWMEEHDSKWTHKSAWANQPPSSPLQVPGSKFNTTYNLTHFDNALSFFNEAPAKAPSYSRPSSPLQRPLNAVPLIRRIPSWESMASTSTSVTAASRSTLPSYAGSSYYGASSASRSTTATLRPGSLPAGMPHNYTHEHEREPVRGRGRGGYLPKHV